MHSPAIKECRIIHSGFVIPHNGYRDTQGAAQTPSVEVVELDLVLSQRASLEKLQENSPSISARTRGKGDDGKEGSQDPRL